MTERDTIEQIKVNQKSSMNFYDYTNHIIFVAPIAFITIGLSLSYNYLKFETGSNILFGAILLLSFGSFLFTFFVKRLRENNIFERIYLQKNETIENISEEIKTHFKLTGIDIHMDTELGTIVAFTKSTGFSWGEKLTLIFDKDSILINSRSSAISQPFTIYKDKKNIDELRKI